MNDFHRPDNSRPGCYGCDVGEGPQGGYCLICCGAFHGCVDATIMSRLAAESVGEWQALPWHVRLWEWIRS